jgi:hypothetical protein
MPLIAGGVVYAGQQPLFRVTKCRILAMKDA